MDSISDHAPSVPAWTRAQLVLASLVVAAIAAGPSDCRGVPARDASHDPRPPGSTLLYESTLDASSAATEDFEMLPGIGPAKAAAIVARRSSMRGFCSVDDVRRASGIGAGRWADVAPLIRVTPSPRCSSSSRG